MPVTVCFSDLEGTLLPFGEPIIGGGKKLGSIPNSRLVKGLDDINQCPYLIGLRVMMDPSGVRYFKDSSNQRYYMIGDILSLSEIIKGFDVGGIKTGNFLYCWFYCCKHKHNVRKLYHEAELKSKGKSSQATISEADELTSALIFGRFAEDVLEGYSKIGLPLVPCRSMWTTCNVWDMTYDVHKKKPAEIC